MKKKSAVLGMAAAAAFSGASFSALAGPCTFTNGGSRLSSYLSGGKNATCTVLDTTISNVTFSTSTSVTSSEILIEPLTVTNNPGFDFSIGFSIAGSATISFTITAPSINPMTDASLKLHSIGGGPSPTVSETLSNGSSLSVSSSSLSDSTIFAATTSLNVTDTVSLDTGYLVDVQFSQTPTTAPEPSSLALLGVGLSALGFARRRQRP